MSAAGASTEVFGAPVVYPGVSRQPGSLTQQIGEFGAICCTVRVAHTGTSHAELFGAPVAAQALLSSPPSG